MLSYPAVPLWRTYHRVPRSPRFTPRVFLGVACGSHSPACCLLCPPVSFRLFSAPVVPSVSLPARVWYSSNLPCLRPLYYPAFYYRYAYVNCRDACVGVLVRCACFWGLARGARWMRSSGGRLTPGWFRRTFDFVSLRQTATAPIRSTTKASPYSAEAVFAFGSRSCCYCRSLPNSPLSMSVSLFDELESSPNYRVNKRLAPAISCSLMAENTPSSLMVYFRSLPPIRTCFKLSAISAARSPIPGKDIYTSSLCAHHLG